MKRQRLIISVSVAAAFLCGALVIVYNAMHQPPPVAPSLTAQTVPAIAMTTLHGQRITTHDFVGQTLLIHFWASWCTPCIREFPQLIALLQRYPAVQMIAVNVDDDQANMTRFLERLSVPSLPNFHHVWDDGKRVTHDVFQTYRYPETIIVRPDLTLSTKLIGEVDWLSPAVINLIKDDSHAH